MGLPPVRVQFEGQLSTLLGRPSVLPCPGLNLGNPKLTAAGYSWRPEGGFFPQASLVIAGEGASGQVRPWKWVPALLTTFILYFTPQHVTGAVKVEQQQR